MASNQTAMDALINEMDRDVVLVPWSSCLGGYSSVPDDYPLVLGCEEHVSSLGVFVA